MERRIFGVMLSESTHRDRKMIDIVKKELPDLKLGGFYIIAPENACSGEVDLSEWEEVWQYGSNEDELKDTPWLLDGVAPQCPVGGLTDARRAYIPSNVPQDFLKSHYIENYGWIFTIEPNNGNLSKGYVTKKK